MGSNVPCRAIRPDERALDLWSLRRGKVLALVGPSEARKAMRLAQTCRVLAQTPEAAPSTRRVAWDQDCDGTLDDGEITQVRNTAAPVTLSTDAEETDWDEERPTRILSVDFLCAKH